MQAYIGTKIILAEPMDECAFINEFKHQGTGDQVTRAGYHVQYSNPDGSTYDSWSPDSVFERAYRPVSDDEKSLLLPNPEEQKG